MSKFQIGDRVKVPDEYGGYLIGRVIGFRLNGDLSCECEYEVESEDSIAWAYADSCILIPTLQQIKDRKLNCVVHTKTQEETNALIDYLGTYINDAEDLKSDWAYYKEKTLYFVINGKINSFGRLEYLNRNEVALEFSDISQKTTAISDFATGGVSKFRSDGDISYESKWKQIENSIRDIIAEAETAANIIALSISEALSEISNKFYHQPLISPVSAADIYKINESIFKEEIKMGRTFAIVEKTRIDKTCNKTVDIIMTFAWGVDGYSAFTTCDKTEYDAYTGALVAAAKITAAKTEETMLMYQTAINMWGTDMCIAILKTLANRAFDGTFENSFKKWQKGIDRAEKNKMKKKCTCAYCGKLFDTPEEARKHEEWHVENKRKKHENYLIRKEAKRRLAEQEREDKVAQAMRTMNKK